MLPKSIVLFVAVVAVKSATFQGRNIPVEIRYERFEHGIDSNLDERIQISGKEIKENNLRLGIAEEDVVPAKDHPNFIRNFAEKVQLSPEQLLQYSKHLPVDPESQEQDYTDNRKVLGELRGNPLPETKSDTLSQAGFIERAQDIVQKGLENLRKNFQPKDNERSPSEADWDTLESNLKEYFTEERNKLEFRQTQPTQPQNIFQNIANGIQQVTNNFVQQFQGQNQTGTSGDEGQAPQQQEGPFQGFVGYFTGGVQNIVSTIQNIGQPAAAGNSTVLGDSGTGINQQPGNFIGNIVTNVQQLFQGQIQGNGTQGDTPSGGTQQGFFAGAINQFNQVVSNIIPTSSQTPPGAAGDEGANPAPPSQTGPFQQVVQGFGNIGTAINQFIQGPQQTKPPGSEDENAGNPPPNQNFVQSIGQNIGNAIQSIQNQFRPPGAPQTPGAEGSSGGSTNPIVGQVSNIGNQLQQIAGQQAGSNPIQNLIPAVLDKTPPQKPCYPSPCGPNSQCRKVKGQAVCSCLPNYIGSPPGCRPACIVSSECPLSKSCINQKCADPCPGTCGLNAKCQVINHSPICSCNIGHTGDPFTRCYPIPPTPVPRPEPQPINPCVPSPCGPNSQCRIINKAPSCSCLPEYIGSPPNCRPECIVNLECSSNLACIRQKCSDPCLGACGSGAQCSVINHTPICTCPNGYIGDPFSFCNLQPPEIKPVIQEPCNLSPCGPNAQCHNGICTCLPEYQGDPYIGCRPECLLNTDCGRNLACLRQKCRDPCPETCGQNTECTVFNYIPTCSCLPGFVGNAFVLCNKIERSSAASPSKQPVEQPAEQRLEEASTIFDTTETTEAETKESGKKEEVMTAIE